MWFSYVNWKVYWFTHGSPNPLFYRCKFSPRLLLILLFRKTAARIAASEATWRLPSSPIVEKNMWFSYVNWKVYWFTQGSPNPLFYRCKFSPRLQIRLLFRKTAARIAAYERYWRLPSSPIVRKKHVHFLCKSASEYFLRKCVSKYFLRKSVSNEKTIIKIDKNVRMREKQDLILKNCSENGRIWATCIFSRRRQ